eukprot:3013282-Rhodomonas_salina.2
MFADLRNFAILALDYDAVLPILFDTEIGLFLRASLRLGDRANVTAADSCAMWAWQHRGACVALVLPLPVPAHA